jgi:diadenosine tetraphosphatase ApaH/serine/threonine PP2A family protein phosphatase
MPAIDSLPRLELEPMRPFAILADLHANEAATLAVDAWLRCRGIGQAVVLGDIVGYGASPQETVDMVRARGWCAIRGNHEDMLGDLSHVDRTRSLKSAARKALDWTRARLDRESLAYLVALPLAARIGSYALAIHGSLADPRYCYAYIYEFSLDLNAQRLRQLGLDDGGLVFYGHTHHPSSVRVGALDLGELGAGEGEICLPGPDRFLINPGSVGFPRDGNPRASFAVYDPETRSLQRIRVGYDVEAAAEKIRKAGYDDGLAARLRSAR